MLFLLLLIVCIAVRLVALNADPPPWLDWSTGLQTDEGFYTLDARHEALFGTWARGNFHDRLLSPLLSLLQQGVFHMFGAGTLQARMISVAFGLLTVIAFWWGLRAVYDARTALIGAALLGLAPPVVFFNRLALQETPTVFWLVLGFALWGQGRRKTNRAAFFFAGAGVSFALAVIFKASALIALPGLVLLFRRDGRSAVWAFVGLAAALALYGLFWYEPHHAELSRMAAYYREHQIEPHSAHSLWRNVCRGIASPTRGVLPYLLAMLPIPCVLVIRNAIPSASPRIGDGGSDPSLSVWLLSGLGFCLLSSYAPDRYAMLFLPPLAGLAARGAARLRPAVQYAVLALFVVTSGFWYMRAWDGKTYLRSQADAELTRRLPPHSVVIGEMAPALCLDTPFDTAPVQPGLSNDDQPIERLGATEITVTRAPVWQKWWLQRYPNIVQPSHHMMTLALGDRWHTKVDVYAVKAQGESASKR